MPITYRLWYRVEKVTQNPDGTVKILEKVVVISHSQAAAEQLIGYKPGKLQFTFLESHNLTDIATAQEKGESIWKKIDGKWIRITDISQVAIPKRLRHARRRAIR